MHVQNFLLQKIVAIGLLAVSAATAPAQVTLPAPNKGVPELVAILQSQNSEFEKAKACQQLAIVGNATAVPALAGLLSDKHLSTYARTALESLDSPEASLALREACKNLKGDLLLGAIQSIGKRRDDEAIPMLAEFLVSDDSAIRVAAARALAYVGTVETAEMLMAAMKQEPENSRAEIARACLICTQQLVAKGETQKAKKFFQEISGGEFPKDIEHAARYQWNLADGKLARMGLVEVFLMGKPEDIPTVLHALRRVDAEFRPVPELAALLGKLPAGKNITVLECLSDIGDKRALPAILTEASEGKDTAVRVAAINAIAKLGDESSLPTLLAAAKSSDPLVAQASVPAMVSIDSKNVDAAVLDMLDEQNKLALSSAIEIAAGRRITSSVPRLMKLTRNPDQQIRRLAIYAVGQAASVEHFDLLVKLMSQPVDDEQTKGVVEKSLRSAFLRMPQEACAKKLSGAMNNAPEQIQIMLLEQLAAVGGPTALKTVTAAAKGNVDALQDAATRVLGQWLTADAAPEIAELAKSLPKGKYQTRVLRGYIRIARQLDMSMEQRMEVCRNALAIADRKDEKLLVLDVLRRHRSREGFAIANSLSNEPGLKKQVQTTIKRIQDDVGAEKNDETGFVSLFDGKTLNGWKEHTAGFWRVENGAIVGGDLKNKVKQNEFLRSKNTYDDFELRLQFKLIGKKTNAGVQFRTEEIPNDHEVSGYQADLGDGWWGCLYDESRRRKTLAGPPADQRAKPVRLNDWNDYRILCQGKRIQLWINGVQTVDYTEPDPDIPQTGIIALQVHGNLINEAWYRNIRIKTLR